MITLNEKFDTVLKMAELKLRAAELGNKEQGIMSRSEAKICMNEAMRLIKLADKLALTIGLLEPNDFGGV